MIFLGNCFFWCLNDTVSVVSAMHSIFPNINAQGARFHDFWCPSMSQTSTLWWCLWLRCHDSKSDLSGANASLFLQNLLGAAKRKCYKSALRHFNNLNNPVPNEWCWKSEKKTTETWGFQNWKFVGSKIAKFRPKKLQISGPKIAKFHAPKFPISGKIILLNSRT